ncbi:MAG: Uma2 family endonuclease [Caldilineaceae bacterium]|nr:Uma2 family endonuclease [Caldilineaceae bacterium]
MSVAAAAPPIERYRLTSAIFHEMVDKGILNEDDRLELIEGELVTMSPIGPEHMGVVNQIAQILIRQLEQRAIVSIQGPIALDEFSEPQPDLALLVQRDDFYKHSLPRPADVALVIEVADSSLAYDRTIKMPLYARAGIPEAWIVNLIDRWIEVYRDPSTAGYTTLLKILSGKSIAPQAFDDVVVVVDDLLSD